MANFNYIGVNCEAVATITINNNNFNASAIQQGLKTYCLEYGEFFKGIAVGKNKSFTANIGGLEYWCAVYRENNEYHIIVRDCYANAIYSDDLGFGVMSGYNVTLAIIAMQIGIMAMVEHYNNNAEEIMTETMNEYVADAQETFDNLVMDLKAIAPTYAELKTSVDNFAAKKIVEKIAELGEQLLADLGEVSGCTMVEEDGFWFNTYEFEKWGCGYTFDHIDELEDLIDTLDYYIDFYSDNALGFDEEDMEIMEDHYAYVFGEYPHYLWEDLRDFASTMYHYKFCA